VSHLLQNPLVVKAMVAFAFIFLLLLVGIYLIRRVRAQADTGDLPPPRVDGEAAAFSLLAYEGVIRRLKEQEKELENLRRQERDRASESASLSEAVLSNLGSGVVLFTPQSLVRQANPAAKALLGFASPAGLHARDLFRGVSQVRLSEPAGEGLEGLSGAAVLIKAVEQCAREGRLLRRLEADHRSPKGESRVLGITLSPVRSPGGESLGAAALVSDLTEITRLSQQIRTQENMAALGEMSAGIAHEFKNSLATISGYAQMLHQGGGSAPESAQFAAKIAAETDALARIVGDFLNFARPHGMAREALEIRAMLEDCAAEARVRLQWAEAPERILVAGDPVALRQAFSNLLRNSAQAAQAGVEPVVTAAAAVEARQVRLTLRDNGCGIPAERLPRIFIPFFTTKADGTGLGLALVHRILSEHGGSITAASEGQGRGSTFTLTLPPPPVAEIASKSE
jgi:signal transduction histidine kinase